jgi:uncharacterized protein (TIGR02266 family)
MAEGNRKDPRARVLNMTVRYKSATVDEFIENHSHDISRGGIFIKTRSPFPAGTLLKFEVRIAEDQKLMHGVGRVVWRREADRAEESFPAGMGIKFIKTGEGATDLINQLVAAREGVESSFDAGVRESVGTSSGGRPSAVPTAPSVIAARASSVPPTSSPALSVDTSARSLADGAETALTNPAKKRQDQAPEKRKVVLQGPALEAPPPRRMPPAVAAANVSDSAPAREHSRGSIAEETTARRARLPQAESKSPNLGGLLVILALVGLVVFVVNRLRGPGAEPEPPAPTVAAEPPAPPPPAPAAEATPSTEAAAADRAAPAATEAAPAGTAAEPSPTPPQPSPAADPNAASAATTGTVSAEAPAAPAPAVGEPPAAPVGSAAPPAPSLAPPTAAAPAPAPKAAEAPASAKPTPAPAKPAPAPAKAAPPKPRATAPTSPKPAPPAASETAKPSEPSPAPPSAGGGGETSSATPPRAKKPAPSEPSPPVPTAPTTPANDNPY